MVQNTPMRQPYERQGIISPGLPVLLPGVERYPLPAGSTQALRIEAGDEISLLNCEGKQTAELVFFAADGKTGTEALGHPGTHDSCALNHALSLGGGGQKVRRALNTAGLDLTQAKAARLFHAQSATGAQETLYAQQGGLLLVGAIGAPMQPDQQDTLTDLVIYLRRASGHDESVQAPLPDPLADPIQQEIIAPGEARAYTVKAGEYIQVLDIYGRECSDFQAFSQRALDQGKIRHIDPTTTRSIMGSLYPKPGLFGKYWSVDQEPLLELIQDTCGRHDTFGIACSARYYEDLGYPGHKNCSDNINIQLAPYQIPTQVGWPAINFFFNTLLDDDHNVGMDDPWSRPGDYVLMRALTDLVCVSTACPCDIDPANGWNPTDILLRTYDKKELFKTSIGWRASTEADMQQTQKTGFHDAFSRFTRNFVEYNGYWLANDMHASGAIAEYWACRERAAIMDLSPLRKYEVTGPDAEELMQKTLTRNMKKLSVGQVVYTAMCYEHGGMIDDGTVFRLGDNNFRWIGGNDESGQWLRQQAQELGLNAWVRNATNQLCNVAVQGPRAREILEQVIWTPPSQPTLTELGWFRFNIARLHDIQGPACVVSRTGYSGELGYEVFCHPNDATQIFDAIYTAGEPYGMLPLGLTALNMLRIEAGLIFAGYEFSDQTDPFEAGIGFTVPLKSKTDDFIGRQALIRRKELPQRQLVGLEIQSGQVPATGDCLRIGKAQVGEITSAVKSPILGRVIALARIDVTHAQIGTEIEVGQLDGHQKRLRATVCAFPHFDPKKERVKGNYSTT